VPNQYRKKTTGKNIAKLTELKSIIRSRLQRVLNCFTPSFLKVKYSAIIIYLMNFS